jgi:hypothetical protein
VRTLKDDFDKIAFGRIGKYLLLRHYTTSLVPQRNSQPKQIDSINEAITEPQWKNSLLNKNKETNLPQRVRDIIPVARTALRTEE